MPERPYRRRELHDHYARSRPPCPERPDYDQSTPDGLRPCERLCARCGRVTARRDPAGMPWCGGDQITADGRTREIAPARWLSPLGPRLAAS